MEPCSTPYFTVPVSEKTLLIEPKNYLFERQDSNHLIIDVKNQNLSTEPEKKYFEWFVLKPD